MAASASGVFGGATVWEEAMPDSSKYQDMSVSELEKMAREQGISGASGMKKEELIRALESHSRSGSRHREK